MNNPSSAQCIGVQVLWIQTCRTYYEEMQHGNWQKIPVSQGSHAALPWAGCGPEWQGSHSCAMSYRKQINGMNMSMLSCLLNSNQICTRDGRSWLTFCNFCQISLDEVEQFDITILPPPLGSRLVVLQPFDQKAGVADWTTQRDGVDGDKVCVWLIERHIEVFCTERIASYSFGTLERCQQVSMHFLNLSYGCLQFQKDTKAKKQLLASGSCEITSARTTWPTSLECSTLMEVTAKWWRNTPKTRSVTLTRGMPDL